MKINIITPSGKEEVDAFFAFKLYDKNFYVTLCKEAETERYAVTEFETGMALPEISERSVQEAITKAHQLIFSMTERLFMEGFDKAKKKIQDKFQIDFVNK